MTCSASADACTVCNASYALVSGACVACSAGCGNCASAT